MRKQIREILEKYNFNPYSIDLFRPISEIINNVKDILIFNSNYSVDESRLLVAELMQLEKKEKLDKLQQNSSYCVNIAEILKDSNYSIQENYLICNKFIPCAAIKTHNKFQILNTNQIKKLTELGYGIQKYKFELAETIRDIYCDGKHPNVHRYSRSFCFDSSLSQLDLTKDNIQQIEIMLEQFNLTSIFVAANQYDDIKEVIE